MAPQRALVQAGTRRNLLMGGAAMLLGHGSVPAASTARAAARATSSPESASLLLRPQAQFSLPFHLVNGYILIDARIGAQAGRLMFDTGTPFPFLFNRHVLALAKDQYLAQGQAASGQKLVLYRQKAAVRGLVLSGGLAFKPLQGQPHADFGFLERAISRQFLGMLGHGFSRDYEFAIDYQQQRLDFHALPPASEGSDPADLLYQADPGARQLLALDFQPTGSGGKMPEFELQLGEQVLQGFADTGNPGSLELRPEMRQRLEDRGVLRVQPGIFLNGEAQSYLRASVRGLRLQGVELAPMHNLVLRMGASNRMGLGYHFFKNYVSVWNYRRQQIRIYEP